MEADWWKREPVLYQTPHPDTQDPVPAFFSILAWLSL